jgi:hypothetical protein
MFVDLRRKATRRYYYLRDGKKHCVNAEFLAGGAETSAPRAPDRALHELRVLQRRLRTGLPVAA